MLLKEDGVTPDGVSPGILVSTDSLFFYNVDSREGAAHRVLIDADGDGTFDGVDDMATAWLSPDPCSVYGPSEYLPRVPHRGHTEHVEKHVLSADVQISTSNASKAV